MAELSIPEEYERGFLAIRGLEEDQVRELVSVLENEPTTLKRVELQRRIEGKTTIRPSDLDSIMETLISLYALRDSTEDLPLPDFVEVVSEMVDESHVEELKFTDEEDRERFKTKLVQLLGIDSLDIAARAADILYARERTIHGKPRVFTDIRPIFDEGPEPSPRGASIVHTLKMSYHEGGRVRELFVALDTENVNDLIDALDRANSKAEALKKFLDGTDIQYIDLE